MFNPPTKSSSIRFLISFSCVACWSSCFPMGMEQIEGRVAYLLHDAAFHPRARRAVRYAGQGMGTRTGLVQVRAHART